jgi:hypothetical protein
MLDLGQPRSDLAQLTDEELLDRGNAASHAYEGTETETLVSASLVSASLVGSREP